MEKQEKQYVRSIDFFMGLIFAAMGAYMVIDARKMFEARMLKGIYPSYSNPGVFITFIGGLLLVMGLILAFIGYKGSGNLKRTVTAGLKALVTSVLTWRAVIALALLAVYFLILLGRVEYHISTFAFLVVTMFVFKATKWWKILIIAAISTWAIGYFFGTLAGLPLP